MRTYIRSRNLLLVLDNCEHLPGAIPEVAVPLAVAPELRVLATSRSPLRIQGEQVYRVPPLALRSAVELFVETVPVRHRMRSTPGPIQRS